MNASVNDLAWLAGAWQCEIWDGTFEEVWLAPKSGTVQGVGRHLHGDKTSFMEFMSIEPKEGGLIMWIIVGSPSRGHKEAIPFKMTGCSADAATFENPDHDFPCKIEYKLLSPGRMDCVLTGVRSGEQCCEVFEFAAVKQ